MLRSLRPSGRNGALPMPDPLLAYLAGRRDDYLRELRPLVAQDSGSFDRDDVNALQDRLQARFEQLGLTVTRYPHARFGDDLVARHRGPGSARIMLLGHADTVYPHGTAAARPLQIAGDRV